MIPAWVRSIPIWVYAAIIALAIIGWQRIEVSRYKAQAITFKSAVLTFKSAQQTNLATIAKLQGANADWADKCRADQPEARQQAQASVHGDAKRHAQANANIKTLRKEAEHDISVKAWLAQPVPDSVTRILRQ